VLAGRDGARICGDAALAERTRAGLHTGLEPVGDRAVRETAGESVSDHVSVLGVGQMEGVERCPDRRGGEGWAECEEPTD